MHWMSGATPGEPHDRPLAISPVPDRPHCSRRGRLVKVCPGRVSVDGSSLLPEGLRDHWPHHSPSSRIDSVRPWLWAHRRSSANRAALTRLGQLFQERAAVWSLLRRRFRGTAAQKPPWLLCDTDAGCLGGDHAIGFSARGCGIENPPAPASRHRGWRLVLSAGL